MQIEEIVADQSESSPSTSSLSLWPFLLIAATSFAVVAPFFFYGNPSGHDFEFHLNAWMEVLSQWKQGVLYPRWAALANWGYGEPQFIFYPPASWMLGAALGAILPWKAVPGAFVWVALTLAGCSMFHLARAWLNDRDAIFAAVLYAANPYHLVIVYWRSAFAELLASVLLPLLLLYVLRLGEDKGRAIFPLALIVAAAWLTNAPAAVMMNYSLVFLAIAAAVLQRSPRILYRAAIAAVLAAALAAFYIVPATYEQKWVAISQVLAPGLRPQDNFLFTRIADTDHNRFNLLVSIIASAEMLVLAAAAFFSFRRRQAPTRLRWLLLAWGFVLVLMFPISQPLWGMLPFLRFLQVSWRWLLCLNVSFTLLVTLAWTRRLYQAVVCLAVLLVLLFAGIRVQPPWWDNAAEIAKMVDLHHYGQGYEGADEYVPRWADAYDARPNAPPVAFKDGSDMHAEVEQWTPEFKVFTAEVAHPGKLVLHLFNYPAWRVQVNGRIVTAETDNDAGQMLVPLDSGQNRVQVTFTRTWDRTAGGIVSAAAAMLLLGVAVLKRNAASIPAKPL